MGKYYFFCIFFLSISTASIYGFSNTDTTSYRDNNFRSLFLPPVVNFSFTSDGTCSGTPITFTPIVTGNSPFKYVWDFGDGSTSTQTNPSYAFVALGCGSQNFSVKLTVTDTNGEVNSITKNVLVKQKPDLKFTNLNAPVGSSTPFEKCGDNNSDPKYTIKLGNISNSMSCITSYTVDWGDGTLETAVTFPKTHIYTKLGSYNMIVTGQQRL